MLGSDSDETISDGEAYKWFWATLDEYLSRHKLKQTKQRQIVVDHFLHLNDHTAAEDLHEVVREAGHNIGLATIYRTLNLLEDAGLVDQKEFGDGRSLFEVRQPGEHHDHIICTDCGAVMEFENDEIEALQERVAKKHDIELTSHRLDLFGRCLRKNCDRKP